MSESIPIDPETIPHEAIDKIIKWLGIGYETTVKRKSDGSKIVIRILSEEDDKKKKDELNLLKENARND